MEYLSSPMLAIKEKTPYPIPKISTRGAIVAENIDEELSTLLGSRSRFTHTTPTTISQLENRCDQWFSYSHSISNIKPHYPVALERSQLQDIKFTWADSFNPSKKHSHTSIRSEEVVVVYNIAAVYSQMAAAEDQMEDEGLTNAYNQFQNSAGALQYLRESYGGGESLDVSRECVSMLEKLMVAQAQECFLYQAVRRGFSSTNCSLVARLVGLSYEEVQQALNTKKLKQHIDKGWFASKAVWLFKKREAKGWFAHVKLKAAQFYAESCYYYSLHLSESEEIGEEIARLRKGLDHLRSTRKSIKGASSLLINVISRVENKIYLRLEQAVQNNNIHRMRVPAAGSLSDLPAWTRMERPRPPEKLALLNGINRIGRTPMA